MRLFAQLSWYFRREWRRYLGAVALLVIIAMLQLVPPKVVGIVVDGVTEQHFTTGQILMWIATMVLIAVVVYLLRYVWRVLLFGASYQLAVELREDYYRQLSRQHPEFYLRHRTGDLMARATNDVDRVVFAVNGGAGAAGMFAAVTVDVERAALGELGVDMADEALIEALAAAVLVRVDTWAVAANTPQGAAGPLAPVLGEYFDMVPLLGRQVAAVSPSGLPLAVGVFAGLDIWGRATIKTDAGEQEFPPEAVRIRGL